LAKVRHRKGWCRTLAARRGMCRPPA
jgi:hypothetical protein